MKTSNIPTQELYRTDRHFVVCRTCRKRHAFYPDNDSHLKQQYDDFSERHPAWKGCHVYVMTPAQIEALARRTEDRKRANHDALNYAHNSDVKEAFQTEQSMTVTNLHSLANSATAGWGSAAVDNSSNLYLDSVVMVHLAAVNTAPGSDKAFYLYGYGSTDGAIWTSTGTSGGTVGTEGTLTFPSVSTLGIVMPLIGTLPYPVQNKALDGGPYSVARIMGYLPKSWGVAAINFTGFTLAAAANTVKYTGLYNTVV